MTTQYLDHHQLPGQFEASPAESNMSAPSENYPSLFSGSSVSSPTMNPLDALTPVSSLPLDAMSPITINSPGQDQTGEDPAASSRQGKKKRKSWGQVLPEPKTNLPPRKRAKTEDEKEQRRVERVLRNRRAAQSSRERKRQEVELLEERNRELEQQLKAAEENMAQLRQELVRVSNGQPPSAATFNSPLDRTLSANLFKADTKPATINPAEASLSPQPEETPSQQEQPQPQALQLPTASDVTQHSAAMLCDLPCQSEPVTNNREAQAWAWMTYLVSILQLSVFSAWQHPLTQLSISLKTGSPLAPSPPILTEILWLVTRPTSTKPSKSRASSTRTRSTTILSTLGWPLASTVPISSFSTKCSNLKVKLLRKILSSSPILARPLYDATLVALRLVSEGSQNLKANTLVGDETIAYPDNSELTQLLQDMSLPSRETLLTLAWTLQVEMKKMTSRRRSSSIATISSVGPTMAVQQDAAVEA